ncbi:MAG: 6,7-dimethyl-8-ribityllumazine synthase [Gammaproteobacteria bacterium]
MASVNIIEGDLLAATGRFAVLAARFNGFIVESLVGGAIDTLRRHGVAVEAIDLVWVPGSFELPVVAQRLAASRKYVGIVALGAVIRGATAHFDYVAGECAKGLAKVALDHDLPVGFGVLTVDSIEQAVERAGAKAGNKGVDAALTVLEMVNLLRKLAN